MSGMERGLVYRPEIAPLGDHALVVRFGSKLDDSANRAALSLAFRLASDPIVGVIEVVPSLISVLVRYAPNRIDLVRLSGEIGLRLGAAGPAASSAIHDIPVRFEGPDLSEVSSRLGIGKQRFVAMHNAAPLRVLATGFAPGFVYCGFHPESMVLPRRAEVRSMVPAGSVLFAAGQTAIAATDIPTGWHVIGSTDFRNFKPESHLPTLLRAGDTVRFEAAG
ncbi:5-oxoprolinase subunit B family protein [Devosia sp. CAU 1758]